MASIQQARLGRIALCVLFASVIAVNALTLGGWLKSDLWDINAFLHSGEAHRLGLNPYAYHDTITPLPGNPTALNMNPPISALFFDALAPLGPETTQAILLWGSLIFIVATCVLLAKAYPSHRNLATFLAIGANAGVWHTLHGQIYGPLILAMACAWLLLRKGDFFTAGLLIGVTVALKPNFAVLPLFLVLAGHNRTGVAAIATAAVISAVPLLVDGPQIYLQWLDVATSFHAIGIGTNASLPALAAQAGWATAGYALALVALVGVGTWMWRERPPILNVTAAGIVVALLCGPASWAGYTLFLLPWLFAREWTPRLWAFSLLMSVPFLVSRHWSEGSVALSVTLGATYAWALLLVAATLFAERKASAPEASPAAQDTDDTQPRIWERSAVSGVKLSKEVA